MTKSQRRDEILKAIYGCEWMETFAAAGAMTRYREEESALLARLDGLGCIPERKADSDIDTSGMMDNLARMLNAIDRR